MLVFVTYITPKEIFHAFTHHIDTEHIALTEKDGLKISNEHHHCELLKVDQQFTAADVLILPFYFNCPVHYIEAPHSIIHHQFVTGDIASFKQLRAPPFVVA